VCFFYRYLGCTVEFPHTHEPPPKIFASHIVILHARASSSDLYITHCTSSWIHASSSDLCVTLLHFLSDPCLFKRPLSHALQLLAHSFFFKGSLCITQKLLLLRNIKLRRGLGCLPDISIWLLTRAFTMLKVFPCLRPSTGYYPDVCFLILLLVFAWARHAPCYSWSSCPPTSSVSQDNPQLHVQDYNNMHRAHTT
jgi:hypothetical protein